ncbi:MAG: transcription termination/antitermination protein NusG [Candidatus Nitrospinota bacterium M3_3B_026]
MSDYVCAEVEKGWFALYVRYQNEHKIASYIREKLGMDSRVPSRKLWRRRNGRMEFVSKPLLETYVFIRAGRETDDWRRVYRAGGVIDIVRQGRAPAAVPESQIESLERLCDSGLPIHEAEYKRFRAGGLVEVVDGPLRGAVGRFLGSDERTGRFVVNIDLFNRALQTEVDARSVRPL